MKGGKFNYLIIYKSLIDESGNVYNTRLNLNTVVHKSLDSKICSQRKKKREYGRSPSVRNIYMYRRCENRSNKKNRCE